MVGPYKQLIDFTNELIKQAFEFLILENQFSKTCYIDI